MAQNDGNEEKSPLLFGIENSEEILKPKQKYYFGEGRFSGIVNGANVIFTNFSNVIGTCWITTAICGLLFFMTVLLICSTVTNNSIRVPRCAASSLDQFSNQTIHLVHQHISINNNHWKDTEALEIIDKIYEKYPGYTIRLIVVQPEDSSAGRYRRSISRHLTSVSEAVASKLSSSSTKSGSTEMPKTTTTWHKKVTLRRKKRKIDDNMQMMINYDAKRILDMILNGKLADTESKNLKTVNTKATSITTSISPTTIKPVTSVEDIQRRYPNIVLDNTTYHQAFFNSPLYAYWPYLNDDLKIFAIRVLQLWQYGGLSFDLQPHHNNNNIASNNNNNNNSSDVFNPKVVKFVISEKKNYEDLLPIGIVVVDDEALHLESKVPCHAFFGQILMNLRKAQKHTTVKDIMKASIRVFCKHFSANKNYCDTLS